MANRYNQGANYGGVTRFTQAPMSEVEFSKMTADPSWYVPFNGGDIVPVYYAEVLPHDTFKIDLNFVVRQLSTSLRPTMGKLQLDIHAFWVPNRVVNDSWKNVQGENSSGYWNAPQVSLCGLASTATGNTNIPVGSLADYYGLPTQKFMPNAVLAQMNDLKQCGYLAIYNNYYRDQNYQPPIPCTKLNLVKGFMWAKGTGMPNVVVPIGQSASGAPGAGAIQKAIDGEGSARRSQLTVSRGLTSFSFLDKPLKANKLHDAFTSVLPSPQKGPEVVFSANGELPVSFKLGDDINDFGRLGEHNGLEFGLSNSMQLLGDNSSYRLSLRDYSESRDTGAVVVHGGDYYTPDSSGAGILEATAGISGWNLNGSVDISQIGISVSDLRTSIATQQVLELLARGGSRYWSFLKSFFGVEVDNPYPDIPTQIGHIRRDLDLYQVAQTSASQEGGSPQGSLTAFGYTTKGGAIFTKTFLEHGYIHIFAVVRHRSIYSSYVSPDNFRRNTMDFYLPQFANISEQPVRLATLNPFASDALERAIGYQEAWWEYRYEPDRTCGILRSGVPGSLDVWHFGNYFDEDFTHVNGDWLVSDTQEILDRTLAITSELAPQFIGQFDWKVTKQRPMPVYSVPGLDMI